MASNREALRRITRKFPAPPELEKILADLRSHADISVAIIGAALVDAALERLITTRFISKEANLIGRIFLNRGPLSDFDSKILVAEAFGIITSRIGHELHILKAVRNAFAHSKMPLSFEYDLIDKELKTSFLMAATMTEITSNGRSITWSNKEKFLIGVRIMLIMMDEIGKDKRHADQVLADALKPDA